GREFPKMTAERSWRFFHDCCLVPSTETQERKTVMTIATIDAKIRPEHLERRAFVYIRQSSPQQLRDHAEGRRRQFQMTDWAERTGWPRERIVVIDEEGKTAAIPKARMAFGDLITAVGRGEAGIVISLEVSCLARNSPDWHHLIYL